MKTETLSVRVLGIRLVLGKTFGFARLADRGGDAFVSPPLMRRIEGNVPPHAIVEIAEKGRRVVRFLDKPEVLFVWEGERDEERMIALVSELAKQWADRKEAESSFIWSVQDTGNKEFQSLWSAALGAGEAGKFLSHWEKEFFVPARREEVSGRLGRLFAVWREGLPQKAEELAVKAYESARKGHAFELDGEYGHQFGGYFIPWWHQYAPAEMQMRVECLRQEFLAPVREARESGRAEANQRVREQVRLDEIWRATEYARERHGVWQGLVLAGLDDLVNPDEPLNRWSMAGRYFPTPDATSGELHATRWYRERREVEVRRLLAEIATTVKVEYQRTWHEAASYDPEYYCRNDDPDNLYCGAGTGEYVGGGERSESFRWYIEATERIYAADKVAGFRADLNALVADELHRQMVALDAETLGESKLSWATEEKLFLHESKERLRQIRAEEARLKEEAKVAELRELGLREEEARLAAADKAEEKRLLDIASVRKNWEQMLLWTPGSRGYRRLRLHPEAEAILEEMREKQGELKEQACLAEQRRAEEVVRQKQAEKEGFLGKGAWGALNNLKL